MRNLQSRQPCPKEGEREKEKGSERVGKISGVRERQMKGWSIKVERT